MLETWTSLELSISWSPKAKKPPKSLSYLAHNWAESISGLAQIAGPWSGPKKRYFPCQSLAIPATYCHAGPALAMALTLAFAGEWFTLTLTIIIEFFTPLMPPRRGNPISRFGVSWPVASVQVSMCPGMSELSPPMLPVSFTLVKYIFKYLPCWVGQARNRARGRAILLTRPSAKRIFHELQIKAFFVMSVVRRLSVHTG